MRPFSLPACGLGALRRGFCMMLFVLVGVVTGRRAIGDVVVAVPGPEVGRYAAAAAEIERGVERAVRVLNESGGVDGETVIVERRDDGCSQVGGEALARVLVAERAALVVGHPCGNAGVAAGGVYEQGSLLFFAPSIRHPALTAGRSDGLVFRLAGRDDLQGATAAAWLLQQAPHKRVAIVHDRTGYARAIAEGAHKLLLAGGISAPSVLTIVAGKRDYDDIAQRLKADGTEAVLFAGYPDEAQIVLAGFRRAQITPAVLCSDSLAASDFLPSSGGYDGMLRVLIAADPGESLERRAEAAVEAWAVAVKRAGSREARAVARALRTGEVETRALGAVSFSQEGDVRTHSFVVARPAPDGRLRD